MNILDTSHNDWIFLRVVIFANLMALSSFVWRDRLSSSSSAESIACWSFFWAAIGSTERILSLFESGKHLIFVFNSNLVQEIDGLPCLFSVVLRLHIC